MREVEHTIWRVVDSHWRCINNTAIDCCLADYLWYYGFNIPEAITYCLADNGRFTLKFRHDGGCISCYINPSKF